VVDIKAVDIGDGPAIFDEKGGEIEEPQGLGPEVIGREVVQPGVNQQEMSSVVSHQPSSIVRDHLILDLCALRRG
jgi:hypothetical protein